MIKTFVKIVVDTRKVLAGLKKSMANNLQRKAMRKTLAVMREDVRALLPTNTGTEKKSVTVKVSIKRTHVSGIVGPRRGYPGKAKMPPTRYAGIVEGGRKAVRVVNKRFLSDGKTFYGVQVKPVTGKHTFANLQRSKGKAYAEDFNRNLRALLPEALPK